MVSLKVAEANDGGFTVTDNVLTFDGGKLTIAQASITEAAPGVFTSTAHGLSVGDAVTYYSNGGTSIDVLTNGATYYVTATTFAADTFTLATARGGNAVTVANDGNDLQFFAKTATPAAGSVAGNQGRSAFGTGVPGTGKAHAASGDCHVYEYKGGAGQATEPTRPGFGHTTIYDPGVSIRQIKSVASSTSLLLGAKADTLTKTGSEPANVIGDPHEPFQNANPVRSGTDYRCPFVGEEAVNHAGLQLQISRPAPATTYSDTDTTFVLTPAGSTGWDIVVGDYIKVGTSKTDTVDFMPSTSGACLTSTQGTIANNDFIYYVHHNCPTFGDVIQDVAPANHKTNTPGATLATNANSIPVDDIDAGTAFTAGTYYKLGSEIFLVTAVNTGTNTMTVERNVQTIPCRPSVAQTFGDDLGGFRPVVFSATNNPNTDGEDYQIDSNRLKAGTAYMAGALGDMLEDVSRVTNDAANPATDVHEAGSPTADTNSNPLAGLLGGGATTYFASPWGKGGNVTDFCYAAGSRSTTVKTDPGSATTGTSDTMQVNSLDAR